MNKCTRQPKICKLKLRHNDKEKICKFFVAHNGSPAVLGMQDIDRLGMLSIIAIQKTDKWQRKAMKTKVKVLGKQKVTGISS